MELSSKDRSYVKENYNFNQRQFNALEKAYRKLSHMFSLDELLEKYRKFAFTPDEIIKYADRVGNQSQKVRYVAKEEVEDQGRDKGKESGGGERDKDRGDGKEKVREVEKLTQKEKEKSIEI